MAEASTTVAAPTDEGKETEEMDNQELLQLLRADMSSAERRTDRRFDELKAEIKEVKHEVAAVERRVTAYVDKRLDDGIKAVNKRIDDLRDYIEANRLFKNNWRTFLIAALATAAVLGTFILQLVEAIL